MMILSSSPEEEEEEKSIIHKEIVLKKIKSSRYFSKACKNDEEAMNRLAIGISDKKMLKNFYLNTNWAQTVINTVTTSRSLFEGLGIKSSPLSSQSGGESRRNKLGIFQMTSKSDEKEIQEVIRGDDIAAELDQDDSDDELHFNYLVSPEYLKIQKTLMNQDKLRIKIIITDIVESRTGKVARQIVSPLLAKTKFLPDLGIYHSAILIGPWKLDWVNASLCIPKSLTGSDAIIACDLTDDLTISGCDINDLADKIADVVIKWNTTMEYKNIGGDEKYGNCQDFVDAILDAIGVDKSVIYQGAMGTYFERLKKKGRSGMKFVFNENFRKKFNIPSNQKHIKFTTHCELDQFVLQLLDIDPLFDQSHPSEFKLLKSFDRAFWLRNYSDPSQKKWEPHREEKQGFDGVELHLKCPFGDPKEKYSFIFENQE